MDLCPYFLGDIGGPAIGVYVDLYWGRLLSGLSGHGNPPLALNYMRATYRKQSRGAVVPSVLP